MPTRLIVFLLWIAASAVRGETPAPPAAPEACGLLTGAEIEAVQGSPVIDTKSSGQSDANFHVTQCYFSTKESNRSVSLVVTTKDPAQTTGRTVKDLWNETFGRLTHDEKSKATAPKPAKEREKGEEEEENHVPPTEITGLGDAAYWLGNRVGGTLYVLHHDAMIRISVGGPMPTEKKIENSKALAQKIVSRL